MTAPDPLVCLQSRANGGPILCGAPISDHCAACLACTWGLNATCMKARRAARHVHSEACLCVMVPMDVEGASECHYCGVHGVYGKPCGDRCDVARAEVIARG